MTHENDPSASQVFTTTKLHPRGDPRGDTWPGSTVPWGTLVAFTREGTSSRSDFVPVSRALPLLPRRAVTRCDAWIVNACASSFSFQEQSCRQRGQKEIRGRPCGSPCLQSVRHATRSSGGVVRSRNSPGEPRQRSKYTTYKRVLFFFWERGVGGWGERTKFQTRLKLYLFSKNVVLASKPNGLLTCRDACCRPGFVTTVPSCMIIWCACPPESPPSDSVVCDCVDGVAYRMPELYMSGMLPLVNTTFCPLASLFPCMARTLIGMFDIGLEWFKGLSPVWWSWPSWWLCDAAVQLTFMWELAVVVAACILWRCSWGLTCNKVWENLR